MPVLRLRQIQLPELHLPEMTREDIVRSIGDATRDVDLPKVDLSEIDIPKAITTAVDSVRIGRSSGRSRLPFVIGGLVTLALVGFALLSSPMVRPRLSELGQKVKQRIDERRSTEAASGDVATPASPPASEVPIEPAAFTSDASAMEAVRA